MSQHNKTTTQWTLASVAWLDPNMDFILSRQAMNCAPATFEFYKYTAGFFLAWIEPRGMRETYTRLVSPVVGDKERGRDGEKLFDIPLQIAQQIAALLIEYVAHSKGTMRSADGINVPPLEGNGEG